MTLRKPLDTRRHGPQDVWAAEARCAWSRGSSLTDLQNAARIIDASATAVASMEYASSFKRYRHLSNRSAAKWRSALTRIASSVEGSVRALDVGCGNGRFTVMLAGLTLTHPISVVALDRSHQMTLATADRARRMGLSNVEIVTADFMNWQPGETYDLVFVSEILQLVRDRDAFFERLRRAVKPRGVLVIRTPSHRQLDAIEWFNAFPDLLRADKARTPDLQEIGDLATQHGFELDRSINLDESALLDPDTYYNALLERAFSILHLIDDDVLRAGIERLKQSLTNGQAVRRNAPMTLLSCATRNWNTPHDEEVGNMGEFVVKHLNQIVKEEAHGGSGARQLLFSQADGVSNHLEAVTKGFLEPGAKFDWHDHNTDEFFIVLDGEGRVFHREPEGEEVAHNYAAGGIFYCRAGLQHKIESDGAVPSEYIFVRLDS